MRNRRYQPPLRHQENNGHNHEKRQEFSNGPRTSNNNNQYRNRGRGDSYERMGYDDMGFDNGYEASQRENFYDGEQQWNDFENAGRRDDYADNGSFYSSYGPGRNEHNDYGMNSGNGDGLSGHRYSRASRGYRPRDNGHSSYEYQNMDAFYDEDDYDSYQDREFGTGGPYRQNYSRSEYMNPDRQISSRQYREQYESRRHEPSGNEERSYNRSSRSGEYERHARGPRYSGTGARHHRY